MTRIEECVRGRKSSTLPPVSQRVSLAGMGMDVPQSHRPVTEALRTGFLKNGFVIELPFCQVSMWRRSKSFDARMKQEPPIFGRGLCGRAFKGYRLGGFPPRGAPDTLRAAFENNGPESAATASATA